MALPTRRVIFALVAPIQRFFRLQAAGGIVLVVAAVVALVLANSSVGEVYQHVVHVPLRIGAGSREVSVPLHSLVNDGLMTIFFVVAGMEIKREIVNGELRTLRRAALPLIAAGGGMLVPALIYLAFNHGSRTRVGWAIPTATDIAFALGCLSLVRRRIPWSLFVFLTALAIFDDLGAILIIALAYGSATYLPAILVAAALAAVLFALARAKVYTPWLYLVVGVLLWIAVARSGLHPTLAGVIVGLAIPTKGKHSVREALVDLDVAVERLRQLPDDRTVGALSAIERHLEAVQAPVERLLHGLHAPVAFGIVPLFALANAGVVLGGDVPLAGSVSLGVGGGLVIGKFVGVLGGVFLAVRLGVAPLPSGATWRQVAGVALIAGIGFTMSLFVTDLAFQDDGMTAMSAKVGILGGSLVSALLGLAILGLTGAVAAPTEEDISVDHVDLPRFGDDYRVARWEPTAAFVGRTLADAALRREHGVTVLGVFREDENVTRDGTYYRRLEATGPDHALAAGDTLLIVGERPRIDAFMELAGASPTAAEVAREEDGGERGEREEADA